MKLRVIIPVLFFYSLIPYAVEAGVIVDNLTYEGIANAGETYQGTIFIRNTASEPKEVKAYQSDYLFFFDGRSIYGEPGKDPRSNANWITFSPKWLTVPPGGISEINYTVRVPDNEALSGTYWSMFMVEGIAKDSPEADTSKKDEISYGIRQVMRLGIQIVTHIGHTGVRNLKFLKTELLKEKEERILQVDVENIGERWLRPFLWVELYDEKGRNMGRFEGRKRRIYPGTSVRYRVDLTQVPEGKYKALVVADGGGDDVFGATYTLKFK